jgi:hypothetical protein
MNVNRFKRSASSWTRCALPPSSLPPCSRILAWRRCRMHTRTLRTITRRGPDLQNCVRLPLPATHTLRSITYRTAQHHAALLSQSRARV